jgi:hypothetical protein
LSTAKQNVHVVPELSQPRLLLVLLPREVSTSLLAHVGLPMYLLTTRMVFWGIACLFQRDGRTQRHTIPITGAVGRLPLYGRSVLRTRSMDPQHQPTSAESQWGTQIASMSQLVDPCRSRARRSATSQEKLNSQLGSRYLLNAELFEVAIGMKTETLLYVKQQRVIIPLNSDSHACRRKFL